MSRYSDLHTTYPDYSHTHSPACMYDHVGGTYDQLKEERKALPNYGCVIPTVDASKNGWWLSSGSELKDRGQLKSSDTLWWKQKEP